MKAIWNIITVMALANLIAVIGFVWWLHFSGRLNMARVEAVRTILSETIAEQASRESAEAAAAEAKAQQEAEAERMAGPPVTASETLSMRIETSEIDRQRIERLKREVKNLTETLARERRKLDDDRAAFEKRKKAFEDMRARIAAIEGDEQFVKSVGVLEKLDPADAKKTLSQLLTTDREQVVSYLDTMSARARTAVFAEFIKDGQQDVAAELLEEIRVRGLVAPGG